MICYVITLRFYFIIGQIVHIFLSYIIFFFDEKLCDAYANFLFLQLAENGHGTMPESALISAEERVSLFSPYYILSTSMLINCKV